MENLTQDEDLALRTLAEQHAQLKQQIESIESRSHLTSEDEIEEQRLKKLKLHIKDQMNAIVEQHRHATVS